MLRTQVNKERDSAQSLETLLHSNREKEFHTQLAQQEKTTEIQLLRDRLSLSESKGYVKTPSIMIVTKNLEWMPNYLAT